MTTHPTRRDFAKTVALSAAAATLPTSILGQSALTVGHTGITWPNDAIEQAIKDTASMGYAGFEPFGHVLTQWEEKGGLGPVLEQHKLPLISAYCFFNMTDPAKRKEAIALVVGQAKVIKKYGGKVAVLGPNSVTRESYDFKAAKADIVQTLNEASKAIIDVGITPAFHQHTGTCVETRDETYAVMEAVDTRYVKFGPDIGQLQKGGADPVKVVSDFISIVEHMHLKDFDGGPYYLGYCPLGRGKVQISAILDLAKNRRMDGMVMVELDADRDKPAPETPLATVAEAKAYLSKHGVAFRTA